MSERIIFLRWLLFAMIVSRLLLAPEKILAQPTAAEIVDSLFIRASSGEVKYQDLVEPSKKALVEMGELAVPQMLIKLATRDAREMQSVVDIFKGIGEPAVDSLVSRTGDSDAFTRRLAIRCLGEIGSTKAVPTLVDEAAHLDFRTRTAVMTALGQIGDAEAAPAVMAGLADSDELVATAAAVACGEIEDGIEAASLVAALDHPYYGVRYSAAASLAKLKAKAARPLADYLRSRERSLGSAHAVEALGAIGTNDVRDLVISQLGSDDWAIRAAAAEALGNMPGSKSSKALKRAIESERNLLVRAKLQASLRKLSAG